MIIFHSLTPGFSDTRVLAFSSFLSAEVFDVALEAVQALDDRVELPVYLNVTRKQIINGISYSGLITTGLVKSPEGTPPGTWYQRGTSLQLWRQV